MTASKMLVRRADWHRDGPILRALREEVFIREQAVPVAMEWDEFDPVAQHLLARIGALPVGTGRLLPNGHIGRLAVLAAWRGRGAGSALLLKLMDLARAAGLRRVVLNAQVQAIPFYLRHGYRPQGEPFMEAGIAHRQMLREL